MTGEEQLTDTPAGISVRRPKLALGWADEIPAAEWAIYQKAMNALRAAGVRFMLGGGFAQASFTGRWRHTKDMDFYIDPKDRERCVEALTKAGFIDYHDELAYDRRWIYRATHGGMIVDVIWSMANQRAEVEATWLDRATPVVARGERLQVMPIEEFLWCKVYIIQRDRCDWIDLFNVFYSQGPDLDWDHFIERLGEDVPLLQAVLLVYGWLHPDRAALLPQSLRDRLRLPEPVAVPEEAWRDRVRWLDSRLWFSASKERGQRLEI
jgi:hypothetical protein